MYTYYIISRPGWQPLTTGTFLSVYRLRQRACLASELAAVGAGAKAGAVETGAGAKTLVVVERPM